MYGITDSDPDDVMQTVRLVPRILAAGDARLAENLRRATYALDALAGAVYDTVRRAAQSQGCERQFHLADKTGAPIPLEEPLLSVLARTDNEVYVVEGDADAGTDAGAGADADAAPTPRTLGPRDNRRFELEPLHPSVLDGVPLDLYREITDRLATNFPHVRFELRDMWSQALSERHTNRYYLTGPPYANRGPTDPQPYFELVPRTYTKKVLEIDLAPGMKLSLDSELYSVDAQDNLVLAPAVLEALQQFAKPGDVITVDMLDPLVQALPRSAQAKAAGLRGQQLVDFLAVELGQLPGRVDHILRLLTSFPPGTARENVAEQLARLHLHEGAGANAGAAARPVNMARHARVWRAAVAPARVSARRLYATGAILVRAALWLYRNNIASVLLYTVAATVVSGVLQRNTSVIFVLWLYTFLAVLAVVVQMRMHVDLIQRTVLFAYPQVYPVGETPADVLAAVPEPAVRAAVAAASNDEAVDYDAIVQRMVIKPSWLRIAAVCIGSLDPVSYKEWSRQVRQRRSLAYDAARLAVTKQQQIGL